MACSLDVVAVFIHILDVHVIMNISTAHFHLWVATIFVRVHELSVIGVLMIDFTSIRMLWFEMARFVRVVAHAASSTICHGLPKSSTFPPMIVLSCGCACEMVVPPPMWHLNY